MESKKFVSLICEYNPFHFGHKFQMEQLKKEFDAVVCILSGDIVQRGEAAIASKYLRAEAALKSGASLVLELPLPWCCSSARDFASAGVYIADAISSPYLAFGAEDDLDVLLKLNDTVSKDDFSEKVKGFIEESGNLSYPLALSQAVKEYLGEEYASAISKPNNILALEYLLAMKGKNILPFAVKRNFDFKSSSDIRSLGNGEAILGSLPEESKNVFQSVLNSDFPRETNKLDSFIIASLRQMNYKEKPKNIYSATDDLVNKLVENAKDCHTFGDLVSKTTDRVYTSARVRRCILSLVFGITDSSVKKMPTYTTVLAADSKGREILKNAKNNEKLKIITKPVKALEQGIDVKEAYLFSKGIEDIVSLTAPKPAYTDLGRTPKII